MRWILAARAAVADVTLYRYEHPSRYDACNEERLRKFPNEAGRITRVDPKNDGVCLVQTHGSIEIDCVEHPGFSLPGKAVARIRRRRGDGTCSGNIFEELYWNHYDLRWFLEGGCTYFDSAPQYAYHKLSASLGAAALPACAKEWFAMPGVAVETIHIHPQMPNDDGSSRQPVPTGEELCAPDHLTPRMTHYILHGHVVDNCINAVEFSRFDDVRTTFCGFGSRTRENCVKSLSYMCTVGSVLVTSYSMENCDGEQIHRDELSYAMFSNMRSCFSDPYGCLGRVRQEGDSGRCDVNLHAGHVWNVPPFRLIHDGEVCIEGNLTSGTDSTDLIYSQTDLDRARQRCFEAAHNQSVIQNDHRLEQQASYFRMLLRAKAFQIGNLTDLLESNSDEPRLEEHAARLTSRTDEMRGKIVELEGTKVSIEKEMANAERLGLNDLGDDAARSFFVAVKNIESAEMELAEIERLLAATEALLSKNKYDHRLRQEASDLRELIYAKNLLIGNVTDLVVSHADNAKIEKHAAGLKSQADKMRAMIRELRIAKESIKKEVQTGRGSLGEPRGQNGDVLEDAETRIAVAARSLENAEAELADLERLVAATDELISKNENATRERERIVQLEALLAVRDSEIANLRTIVSGIADPEITGSEIADPETTQRSASSNVLIFFLLVLALISGAILQRVLGIEKVFRRFVDDPSSEPNVRDPNEVDSSTTQRAEAGMRDPRGRIETLAI